jgi:hypothetical protein
MLLALELAIGFAGYFSDFREPLVFIGLAILSSQRRRSTWLAIAGIGAISIAAGITWTAIKPVVRQQYSYSASISERLTTVAGIIQPTLANNSTGWKAQADRLVGRIWTIRFPSLAYARVPSVLPHEHGAILWGALTHTVMPRLFFPAKGELPSESDKVRKYSGVWVAGRETGTSWAFGYVADSYVDFGWPLMLVPIFLFGCLMGFADRLMKNLLTHQDVLSGVRTVVLWSSLYLFEQSWVMMIGTSASLFVVLVGGGVVFERVFFRREGVPAKLAGAVPPQVFGRMPTIRARASRAGSTSFD